MCLLSFINANTLLHHLASGTHSMTPLIFLKMVEIISAALSKPCSHSQEKYCVLRPRLNRSDTTGDLLKNTIYNTSDIVFKTGKLLLSV